MPLLPAAGMPEIVAVPLPLSVKITPLGRLPVSPRLGLVNPVVVTGNEPETPGSNVVLLWLVIAGAWLTVSV